MTLDWAVNSLPLSLENASINFLESINLLTQIIRYAEKKLNHLSINHHKASNSNLFVDRVIEKPSNGKQICWHTIGRVELTNFEGLFWTFLIVLKFTLKKKNHVKSSTKQTSDLKFSQLQYKIAKKNLKLNLHIRRSWFGRHSFDYHTWTTRNLKFLIRVLWIKIQTN